MSQVHSIELPTVLNVPPSPLAEGLLSVSACGRSAIEHVAGEVDVREATRRVQAEALELFETRGFDGVTIEEIAAAARVSTPTVYRHFGTKEGIVLWDEYEPLLFAAIAERLPQRPVLNAVGDALVVALDKIYAEDAARILRRLRLVRSEPALGAANAAVISEMKRGLARLLARSCADQFEADVTAGAVVAALEAAVEHWRGATARRRWRSPTGVAYTAPWQSCRSGRDSTCREALLVARR